MSLKTFLSILSAFERVLIQLIHKLGATLCSQ